MYICNAPNSLMKELDYGKGYRPAHGEAEDYATSEVYLPDEPVGQQFYHPLERGLRNQN